MKKDVGTEFCWIYFINKVSLQSYFTNSVSHEKMTFLKNKFSPSFQRDHSIFLLSSVNEINNICRFSDTKPFLDFCIRSNLFMTIQCWIWLANNFLLQFIHLYSQGRFAGNFLVQVVLTWFCNQDSIQLHKMIWEMFTLFLDSERDSCKFKMIFSFKVSQKLYFLCSFLIKRSQ